MRKGVAFRRPMDAGLIEISFHPATHDSSRAAEAYVVWSSAPVGPVLLPPPTPRRITVNGMAAVEASAQWQPPEIPLEPLALPDGNGHVYVEFPHHTKPQLLVTRAVAVPVRGGFFALECTYPVEDASSADAFEAILGSFRLAAPAGR